MTERRKEQGSAKRIVIIIVGVLVLLAAAGYIVWLNLNKPGATTTANKVEPNSESSVSREALAENAYEGWKTYTSPYNPYKIQYPDGWVTVAETASDGLYIRNKEPLATAYTDGYPKDYIEVRVLKTTDEDYSITNSTAAEYFKSLGSTEVSNGAGTYAPGDVKSFTLNGQEAKRVKTVNLQTTEDIVVFGDNSIYTISIIPYGALTNETVTQIIASFTITK